jgi:hypothetical protein
MKDFENEIIKETIDTLDNSWLIEKEKKKLNIKSIFLIIWLIIIWLVVILLSFRKK